MSWLKRADRTTYIILGINIFTFIVLTCFGMTEDAGYMLGKGALYIPYITERGEYYRILTSMFLHFGIYHLGNNMLLLVIVGRQLEPELGSLKFIFIYFLAGIGGTMLSIVGQVVTNEFAIAGGASGAIFGVVGAMLWVVIRNKGAFGSFNSGGLIFVIGLSLYSGLQSTDIDNLAHIGGLATGTLLCVLLYGKSKCKHSSDITREINR